MIEKCNTDDVRRMYEKYPYPSRQIGDNLIYDMAAIISMTIDIDRIVKPKILDLGCGSGHRLIGLASCYPEIHFVGLDMTEKSIQTAKQLAAFHNLQNVSFIHDKIENYRDKEEYDIVVSTGVFHHMENPLKGFEVSYKALKQDGLAIIWLYHTIGEFNRMLQRDLVQIFSKISSPHYYYLNMDILKKLNINLGLCRYGNKSSHNKNFEIDEESLNVDAYLHPIVKTYYYHEINEMALSSRFYKSFCLGFNKEGTSKIIDITNKSSDEVMLKFKDIYSDKELNNLYEKLNYDEKINALELSWKPIGITVCTLKSELSLNKIIEFRKNI